MAPKSKVHPRLRQYQAKRDFAVTPEPTGTAAAHGGGRSKQRKELFFCVQKHLASHLHYDFRLEHKGVLLSWAVPKGPSLNPADKRLAMRVEDHPFEYGDFEGVIPEGYGAGIVMLWDQGTWTPEVQDVQAALRKGDLKFRLDGVKLKGSWVLVRTRPRGDETESRSWLLIKHRDEWAGPIDVIREAPLSVKSFGDFDDILAADDPDIWESHRPVSGGATGKLLATVIEQAAAKKENRKVEKSKRRNEGATRKTQAARPAAPQKARRSGAGGRGRARESSGKTKK